MKFFKNKNKTRQLIHFGLSIAIFIGLNFSFLGAAFASTSADFQLDFGGVTTGSEKFVSSDFDIQAGTTGIETNSNSQDFQITTINNFPSPTLPVCGNGIIETGEVCDSGNFNGQTCSDFGFDSGSLICNSCTSISTASCQDDGGGNGFEPPELPFPGPEEPDTPTEPEEPDNPTEPEVPDTPTEPEVPDTPTEPEVPDTPTEPEDPDTPTEPKVPDTPTETQAPDTPTEPEDKDGGSETEEESKPKLKFHLDPYFENEQIFSFGPKILLVDEFEIDEEYTIFVYDLEGKLLEKKKIKTDKNKKLIFENEIDLKAGDYRIEIWDKNEEENIKTYNFNVAENLQGEEQIWIEYLQINEREKIIIESGKDFFAGEFEENEVIKVTGKANKRSTISFYLLGEDGEYYKVESDKEGNFELNNIGNLAVGDYNLLVIAVDENKLVSDFYKVRFKVSESNDFSLREATVKFDWLVFTISLLMILFVSLEVLVNRKKKSKKKLSKKFKKKFKDLLAKLGIASFILITMTNNLTIAASTPDTVIYEGRLLDPIGTPIITAHDFRFSLWISSDFVAGDLDGAGNIDVTAPNYVQWQETHTVTPNSNGTFSIELGTFTPIPAFDFDFEKFLQVEIKSSGAPLTDYQLMDPTGDDGADANDRKSIGSLPYAERAEYADTSDNITFTIDSTDIINTAGTGSVKLKFGNLLNKFLEYDFDNSYFNFNDDVNIEGDLSLDGDITLGGTINGVDITSINPGDSTGTSADTYNVNNDGNGIIFDSSGLSSTIFVTFDDADTVVVGEDNVQTLTNKTIDGSQNTITNIDFNSLDTRDKSITLNAEFEGAAINGDGSDNQATLKLGYDEVVNKQYYVMSSKKSTLQDLDLQVQVTLPEDFVQFQATPLEFVIKTETTDINDNQIDITVLDSTDSLVSLSGANDLVSAIANAYFTQQITFNGGPTFNAGDEITIILKMQSKDDLRSYLNQIKLNYLGR